MDQTQPSPEHLLSWCRLAFEHSPIGISFVTVDRRPMAINDAMCDILGRTREEVLATSIHALTHPADRELHVDQHRLLLAGEIDRYSLEKRYLRPDGPPVWVRLHVALARGTDGQPDLVISQCEDISEVKEAEEALRAERNRFAALVKRSSDLILLLRPTGHIAYASPASERILGYEPLAIKGLRFSDFVHPDDLGRVAQAVAAASVTAGTTLVIRCRVLDFDGQYRPVEATASNWFDDPEVDGLVVNVRDLSEREADRSDP